MTLGTIPKRNARSIARAVHTLDTEFRQANPEVPSHRVIIFGVKAIQDTMLRNGSSIPLRAETITNYGRYEEFADFLKLLGISSAQQATGQWYWSVNKENSNE